MTVLTDFGSTPDDREKAKSRAYKLAAKNVTLTAPKRIPCIGIGTEYARPSYKCTFRLLQGTTEL